MENTTSYQDFVVKEVIAAGVGDISHSSEPGAPPPVSQYPDPDAAPSFLELELLVTDSATQELRPHLSATPAPTPQSVNPPPETPATPSSPVQLFSNLPIRPDHTTRRKCSYLAQFAAPHFELYPPNTSPVVFQTDTIPFHPLQPHRPPTMLPEHPLFVYWGRDLSSPTLLLPKLTNGQNLFVRRDEGGMSDQGFGPGVRVHDDVREEVSQAERRTVEILVPWDARRHGYDSKRRGV